MNPQKRIFLLILIMTLIVILVEASSISLLYNTAFEEERARITEIAKSQARLIEAVARFDRIYSKDYPLGSSEATLNQIRDAHAQYEGFGETGEFTLSMRKGDQIVFLLAHRHFDMDNPKPVPWKSKLAEPMRRALSGRSGTVVALDYRGKMVLAAHEPVGVLNLGIVSKIDLSEIRAPFIRAGVLSGLIAILVIVAGAIVFFRITDPIVKNLHDTVAALKKTLGEVKTLRGILPICSYCKKVRDDKGYWDQVEVYISEKTGADFSHGICPECASKHFGDLDI
jgi:hypothetical protein